MYIYLMVLYGGNEKKKIKVYIIILLIVLQEISE